MKLLKIYIIKRKNDRHGFTLIEILVTIGIFGLLSSVGLFMGYDTYRNYLLNAERDTAMQMLEEARSRALNNMNETSSGVRFESGAFILFRGAAYLPHDAFNETNDANSAVQKGGLMEVTFNGFSGEVNATGTLVLSYGSHQKIISINHEGRINW